jgi:hypothetical protein
MKILGFLMLGQLPVTIIANVFYTLSGEDDRVFNGGILVSEISLIGAALLFFN